MPSYPMLQRHGGWLLPLGVGLALRGGLLAALTAGGAGEAWDAMGYHERGLGFRQALGDLAGGSLPSFEHMDRAYTSYYPPFQMMVLAFGIGVLGESLFASRLTMVLVGAATIPLVHRVTRPRYGGRAAFLAACGFAVYPVFVYHSIGTRSETTYIFLLFAVVALADALLLRLREGSPWKRRSLLLGVVVGLAILTRSVGLPLLFAVPAWLAWAGPSQAATRRAAWSVALAATVTLLPWELTVSFVEQRPVLLSIGDTHDVGAGTPIDREQRQAEIAGWIDEAAPSEAPAVDLQKPLPGFERPLDAVPWSLGLAAWLEEPLTSLGHGLQHWWLLSGVDGLPARQFLAGVFPPSWSGLLPLLLAVTLATQLALWFLVGQGLCAARPSRDAVLLLGVVGAGLAVHFLFGREAKYGVPLQAMLFPLAGFGAVRLIALGRTASSWAGIGLALLLSLSTVTATRAAFAHEVRAASSWYAPEIAVLNRWIKGRLPVSDRIVLRRLPGARATLELEVRTGEHRFVPAGTRRRFDPGQDILRAYVTAADEAEGPVRISIVGPNGTPSTLTPHPDHWQRWTAIPELGVEWMWVGGPFLPVHDLEVLALTGARPGLLPASGSE